MKHIGLTSNYYGGVVVKSEDNKYYWQVEDYKDNDWEQIPEYLYESLIRFQEERLSPLHHETNA